MNDLLDELPVKEVRRIKLGALRIIQRQKQMYKDGYRPALNYSVSVREDNDFPKEGAVYGKWLLLDEQRHGFVTDERMFSIIWSGPLWDSTAMPGNEEKRAIDVWFCSPQLEFAGRTPYKVIGTEGVAGAQAVGEALDAMAPGQSVPINVKTDGRPRRKT